MEVSITTDVGTGQRLNDDGWCAEQLHKNVTLLAVADGFGRPAGTAASVVVLDAMREIVRRELRRATFPRRSLTGNDVRELLRAAFAHANERLLRLGGGSDDFVAAGSTCTAVLIVSNQAFIAHVGDSRAYLLRRGELVSLTSDESLLPDLVRSGSGQTTAFRRGKLRPLLTRALGIETAQAVPPKITHYTLQAHDAMLLCTDGAYRGVALADLQAAVLQKERPEWISDRVVALGRMAGSNDNATAIFARDATLHGAPAEAPAHRQRPRRSFVALTAAVALFWAATLGLMAMWGGSSRLYLGTDGAGAVTLYAGEPASVLGVPLHLARQTYGISQADLPQAIRRELADGVPVGSAEVADSVVAKWQAHRRR